MADDGRILVTTTMRASPDGVHVYAYKAGKVYARDSDPAMPAGLAATFLREGWGEAIEDGEGGSRVHAHDAREAPAGPGSECLWCGAAYARRATGGRPQKFCSSACRRACHAAARRWAVLELEAGRLTVETVLGRG